MYLRMVADILLNKEESVVTVGIDDTTKAAGRKKLYDVKTGHITVCGSNQPRETFTTGFSKNISHTRVDGARAYETKLKCLAALPNSSVDEMKESIDFWMSDRAGDCGTMFKELIVEEKNILLLKCNAHVILGIDHAADKVFRDAEQKIGVQKLIDVKVGKKVFSSHSSSIHTLALIAIAKLLLPSHAAHSVSLYNDFKLWLQTNNIPAASFKGFTANRFGRIADIASEFLNHKDSILIFLILWWMKIQTSLY